MEIIKGIVSMSEQEFKELKTKEQIKGFAEGVLIGLIFMLAFVAWRLGLIFK